MTDQRDPNIPERPTAYQTTPGLPQATRDPPPPPPPRAGNGRRQHYDESPSQAIVASAKHSVVVQDELGRTLRVRYLTGRDRMQLFKVLGPELSKNEMYLGYATLAWTVIELDNGSGEDPRIPPMVKASEVEFLVDRLGDEGLLCAARAFQEHFADRVGMPDIDTAKN